MGIYNKKIFNPSLMVKMHIILSIKGKFKYITIGIIKKYIHILIINTNTM